MYLETNLFEEELTYRYWSAFYHSVLMINGNELGPRSVYQLSYVSAILILGAIINANIFGNLAVIA